jgi:hypothetical protein
MVEAVCNQVDRDADDIPVPEASLRLRVQNGKPNPAT